MPDGVGRSFNLGGGNGRSRPQAALQQRFSAQQQVSIAQAQEQARVAQRMTLLQQQLPSLAYAQPTMLFDLASSQTDTDQMMRQAIDMMAPVQLDQMLEEVRGMSKEQQRGIAAQMDPTKRDALQQAGWQIPEAEKDRGFFGGIAHSIKEHAMKPGAFTPLGGLLQGADTGAASKIAGPLGGAVGKAASMPGVSHVLGAMDYAAEEASRPTRITPLMDSQRRALDQSGMSAEQLLETTGIDAGNASASGRLYDTSQRGLMGMGATRGLSQLVEFAKHPEDIWKAVSTWNEIGHEGSDDYLADVQYEVYQNLEDQFEGQGKDMLRWAKALASGATVQELADSEGLDGDSAAQFVQRVGLLSNSAEFRNAMSRLESGRVSPGRSIARALWDDPTKDVSEGAAKWVSGGADAAFAVAFDPTVVGGKLSKSIKAAKWGMRSAEGAEQLSRWQNLARAVRKIDEGADAAEALADIPRQSAKAVTIRSRQAALEAEGRAVLEPARAVADAFDSDDFGALVRRYPSFERSIGDMKRFDAALKAAGEEGLSNPEQLFEFYKHAAGQRSVLSAIDDTIRIDVKSTKLFGHDGGGKLMVPHSTGLQRKALDARAKFSDWLWDRPGKAPEDVEDYLRSLHDEVDELPNSKLAESDVDPKFAGRDEMEFDPETLGLRRKVPGPVKERMQKLARVLTTPTGQGFITLGDNAPVTPESFRAFNESIGIIAGESKVLAEARYNQFLAANDAGRRALVNQMVMDMASATGLNETEEGLAIVRKHLDHANQVYGKADGVSGLGKQAIFTSQNAEALAVPSFRDMVIATRNVNKMRLITGTTRKSVAEAAMTRVWKPGQILRFAFPLRAGADEALQFIGRVSLHDYLEHSVLDKWAGIRDETTGKVLQESAPAVQPIRSFVHSWANVMGVTDDALAERAQRLASQNPEWATATPFRRLEILQPHYDDLTKGLRVHSKTLRWLDEAAHNLSVWNSKTWHETAVGKRINRESFANKMLEVMHGEEGYAARMRNRRLQMTHPFAQEAMAEVTGHSFAGLRPDVDVDLSKAGIMGLDRESSTGYQFIRAAKTGDYQWLTHDDLGGFYLNLDHTMQMMNRSPEAGAAMDELLHFVPDSVLKEARKAKVVGMDGVRTFRESTSPEARRVLAQAAFDDTPGKVLREQLVAANLPTDGLDDLLAQWDDLSEKTRYLLTDDRLFSDRLTDDLDLALQRAGNASYNALYRLDGQDQLRKLTRAQYVGGKPVAQGVAAGHTRVYAPMVDRRNAEDLVRLLSDPDMAQTFAERLGENLKRNNLFGEMKHVWGVAPPGSEGYDMATWMAGLKASIAQGNGSYIPGLLAGSSNFRVAEAIRDSLDEILPPQVLRPTIGYIDHPDELLTAKFGMGRVEGSQSVVDLASYQGAKLSPIDPDSYVTLNKVQTTTGQTRWLSDAELEGIADGSGEKLDLMMQDGKPKILEIVHGNGVTEEVAVRAAADDIANEVRSVFLGQRNGEPLHEVLAPLRRGEWSMDKLVRNVELADLPTKAYGPQEVMSHQGRWDRVVNRALSGTAEPIIGAISRMPMFNDAFDKAMNALRPVYDNAVHKGLDTEARALLAGKGIDPDDLRDVNELVMGFLKNDRQWGDAGDDLADYAKAVRDGKAGEASAKLSAVLKRDVSLSDEETDLLRRWHLNQSNATEAWVHRSTTRAMELVTPYIDDHRLRSAFQEYIGPVIAPYYYAEEQFLRRFARGIYETPHMLRKGQLLMNGMRNVGMVKPAPGGDGEIFIIPGSDLLTGAIADVAVLLTGNEAFQVIDQPLTMRTEYILPGYNTGSRFGMGPLIGVATEGMTRQFPEMEWRRNDPNRKLWEYVIPGPVSGFYKAFLQDGDPSQVASAQMAAIAYLEANGKGLPEDAPASEREHYKENINQVTKTIGVLRYITGQLTFTGAVPLDPGAYMREEFTDLLNDGLNYEDAVDTFIGRYGPEALSYTVFATENETGAPLSQALNEDAWRYMLDNEDLVRDAPQAMAWLLPQGDSTDKFDRRAYNQQLALGLRTKRSPDELLDQIYIKQAAEDYWDRKDQYDSQRRVAKAGKRDEEVKALDQEWDSWKTGYLAQHPVFAESFSTESADRRKQTITDVEWIIEAGSGGAQGEAIAPMIRAYKAFRAQYDAYANQSSKAARKLKEDILTDYFDEQWAYVQSNPKAAAFWNSVIRPELPDAAKEMEQNKLS